MTPIDRAKCAVALSSALLASCSNMPTMHPIEAAVTEEIAYQEGVGGGYFKISSVQADAAAGQDISAGRLWISYKVDGQLKFMPMAEVKSIFAKTSNHSGPTAIVTKAGATYGTDYRQVSLCPSGVIPDKPYSCPVVRKFFGAKVSRTLPEGSGNKEVRNVENVYSYLSGDVYIPNIFTAEQLKNQFAKDAEYARIAAEAAAKEAKALAERNALVAKQVAIEREQRTRQTIAKLQGVAGGTKVYCISTRPIPRAAAVSPDIEFNCPTIGNVNLGDFDKAGWSTDILGRRPGQQFDLVGDYIDLSATKPR